MTELVKAVTGLGFSIAQMDPDEHEDFPCYFHKLDEDHDPHPCPETPYVFAAFNNEEGGVSFCKRHFALFASDMVTAISCMGQGEGGVAETPELVRVGTNVMTRPAFTEAFMEAKEQINGKDT